MADDNSLVIKINGSAKDFIDELDKVKKETESLNKVLDKTAKAAAKTFAVFAASIALVTKAFSDYETALVGVGKTTNIEGKKLDAFGKKFQKLSSVIPVSTNELLGIAQAAGQLGVSGEENLLKFTETIAKLGVATDLTGEQAATSLTRILNVTNESIGSIDTFGSVIVALGNNFAATESEIVRMTTEVAKSTGVFGVSAAEAAALGTALKSVGIQAQVGGSVVGKSMLKIQKAIDGGGVAAANLSKLTGIAGADLKKAFQDDATGVFQAFVNGLGNMEGGTTAMFKALESFGLKGDEINKVLPVLAKNSELVGRALKTAAKETKNATALNTEAEKAFGTLASTFQKTNNNAVNLATNIGAQLAPQITELLKSLNEVIKSLSEADDETLALIASFIKWGAIIAGTVAGLATIAKGFLGLKAAMIAAKAVLLPLLSGLATVGAAIIGGVTLPVIAATAAIGGVVFALAKFTSGPPIGDLGIDELNKKLDNLKEKLLFNKKIAEETGKDPEKSLAVRQIQAQIDKIDELIKKKQEDRAIDLTRPAEDPLADILAPKIEGIEDIPQQTIPFVSETEVKENQEIENLKKKNAQVEALVDESTQKKIDAAKKENEELSAIAAAGFGAETEEEKKHLERKAEINNEFLEAEKIKNAELREATIENLALKHGDELAAIDEFENLKAENAVVRAEEKAALDLELRELSKEQQALFNEEDQAVLQEKFDTETEAEKKFAETKITKAAKDRNQFLQDEIKFGTNVAKLQQFFRTEEVQGLKSATGQLIALTNSKNSTLKGIGKAAARVNAAIATSEGAIKAYASLSGIPIVGPALGAAAAASLFAFGVEQQSQISAMQTGGFVPNGVGGARDRIPTMLEPNELVVPASVAPNFIQAAGIPDTQGREAVGDQGAGGNAVVEIMLEDRAGEVISLEQREGRTLGIIGD